MHEMSIAESIIRLLQRQAHEQGFNRVKRIRLKIGPLAMVERESLRFCFSAACRGTLAEGAALETSSTVPSGPKATSEPVHWLSRYLRRETALNGEGWVRCPQVR